MYCKKCGASIADLAAICPKCGMPVRSRRIPSSAKSLSSIPNHLVSAILATIFCCTPFGIPAIVFAARTIALVRAGDFDGAMRASKNAYTWILVSVVAVVLAVLFFLVVRLIQAL